jgi:hypothetical protein
VSRDTKITVCVNRPFKAIGCQNWLKLLITVCVNRPKRRHYQAHMGRLFEDMFLKNLYVENPHVHSTVAMEIKTGLE